MDFEASYVCEFYLSQISSSDYFLTISSVALTLFEVSAILSHYRFAQKS